jgi:hypothetical protein
VEDDRLQLYVEELLNALSRLKTDQTNLGSIQAKLNMMGLGIALIKLNRIRTQRKLGRI